MANAQVEKIKDLSLRHGEKVVVALTAVLCLLFLFFAVTKETIETTPEEVSKQAEQARSNLSRRQEPADILTKLEQQGVKDPKFVAQVEEQEKNGLKASDYALARMWVTPEPGAGLIRDKPELIAPEMLAAYPGRGGAVVFELVDGKRVPEDPATKKTEDPATKARKGRKKGRRGSPDMMAGMMSSGGPMPGAAPKELTAEEKRELDRQKKQRSALFAGKAEEAEAKKEEAADDGGPFKEITRGLRWVAITGTLDHKKMRDNYTAALKDPAAANPNYKQLDVQRQTLQSDGTWSDWEDVDMEKNHQITYNLTEEEEELTPESVRINALVDPLPFLTAGFWERVHVASLVPKEKREVAAGVPGAGQMMGSDGMVIQQAVPPPQMMMPPPGMMGMMPGAGGAEDAKIQKTDAPTVMIRSLDYTVEPDVSYRYRARIVVYNPNYQREDVSPGTDTSTLVMNGPWSEPTNEVTMPADIAAYAMRKTPSGPGSKRSDYVSYQIVRWNPDDGITVTRNLDYGPGQIVGEVSNVPIPSTEGTGSKRKAIDFNSHQLMLDEAGGDLPLSPVGVGGKLDVPALTLLMRPDGSVMVRNEAFDLHDPVRKDMSDNYDREIEESNKKRENSNSRNGR